MTKSIHFVRSEKTFFIKNRGVSSIFWWFLLVLAMFFLVFSRSFGASASQPVNKTRTLAALKKIFRLTGKKVNFTYEVTPPASSGRSGKATKSYVEGSFYFFAPGNYGISLTYPANRRGVKVLVSPSSGMVYNPKTGQREPLKSGFRTAALYGGPLTVDAMDALVALSDPATKWSASGEIYLSSHPIWGGVAITLGPRGQTTSLRIKKRFWTNIEVIGSTSRHKMAFPEETLWSLLDKRDSGTAILSLSGWETLKITSSTFLPVSKP